MITAVDAGLAEKSDDEPLAFAAERACVLSTFNLFDLYHRLQGVQHDALRRRTGPAEPGRERRRCEPLLRRRAADAALAAAEPLRDHGSDQRVQADVLLLRPLHQA